MSAEEQQKYSTNGNGRVRGRPFPKGVSGNPGGRPKGSVSPKSELLKLLKRKDANGKTGAALLAERLLAAARRGEPWAVKFAFELVDGKPAQAVGVTVDAPSYFQKVGSMSDDELRALIDRARTE